MYANSLISLRTNKNNKFQDDEEDEEKTSAN